MVLIEVESAHMPVEGLFETAAQFPLERKVQSSQSEERSADPLGVQQLTQTVEVSVVIYGKDGIMAHRDMFRAYLTVDGIPEAVSISVQAQSPQLRRFELSQILSQHEAARVC